ncbi:MAG: retropepsin-like aspartic protease [Novosphingobium sp.]
MNRREVVLGTIISLGLPPPISAKARKSQLTRLISRNQRLFVPARINGHAVLALLDSAAELTLLDRSFAARIGLVGGTETQARGSGAGSVSAQLLDHVTITAPGMMEHLGPAAVVDLTDVSRRLNGVPIVAILGRDYFDQVRLEIDIDARTLRPLGSNDHPAGQLFPLKTEFGVETMDVVAEGRIARATVDLGNGNEPLISRAFASRLGALTDGRTIGQAQGGGIGGEAARERFILKNITIGQKIFIDIPVIVDASENASDLNLGTSVLRHFVVTTDFGNHRLWLRPKN